MIIKHNLQWQVGFSQSNHEQPKQFVPARVPGAANLDWAEALHMPDWKKGVNYKNFKWMEDCYWIYRAQLPDEALEEGTTRWLIGKGIDYQYEIYINNERLYAHEGMFTPFSLDLTGKKGELKIVIFPAPKDSLGTVGTREEAAQCCKPAVSYGWEWHPRLIPVGIWDDLVLEDRPSCYIKDCEITYTLNEDYSRATVVCKALTVDDGELLFTLCAPTGTVIINKSKSLSCEVKNPELWWCNGYGKPNLYTWKLECKKKGKCTDIRSGKIEFRRVKLVMNEGAWNEPKDFPKGRSVAPITIELNGITVFAKGSNWVNPEVFTGMITHETYLPLIKLAHNANFNIFRCWGGAIINKDSFFKLCDEYGIMVWQEFMLACNNYRGTLHYLQILEQEASAIIKRLSMYACVVLWCGGNELFNDWSGMTDQSLALRLLNKLCYELDPQKRPFLMTSPLYGMAHGCYLFTYPDGREVFEVMPHVKQTAYTEFGVPSVSNLDCCLATADSKDFFPIERSDITIAHHAFDAWQAAPDTWCGINTLRRYFGEPKTAEQLIAWSQWLQGEGYKCIFEEARRQKPYCSMAINWCYNEPWPTLANNSIINYPADPKASYQDVKAACRSVLASAQIPHFAWNSGEMFCAALWILNDGIEPIPAGSVDVSLIILDKTYFLLHWEYPKLLANKNFAGPIVRFQLPKSKVASPAHPKQLNMKESPVRGCTATEIKLILSAGDYSSEYKLIFYTD